jgi:hypothetical protein
MIISHMKVCMNCTTADYIIYMWTNEKNNGKSEKERKKINKYESRNINEDEKN